jgi:Undecaprenyl-phosphate galactose phosphotransferase WbaP
VNVQELYEPMSELHAQDSELVSAGGRVFTLGDAVVAETWPERGSTRTRRSELPRQLFRYRVVKRGMDVAIILLLSPILLLLVVVIAALVRLSSPGPIFFSHRRIERHGAFFTMWKFRTMCVNSAEVLEAYLASHPEAKAEWRKSHKLKQDPRVTKLGEFLRKTSLDELPQLWNVFTGKMSLVGPRPIVAAEVEKYGEFFADYCRVKPGVTGLWQVSGRSTCTYAERVQLDRKYADTWSLRGDVAILLRTLSAVVNQDGAY